MKADRLSVIALTLCASLCVCGGDATNDTAERITIAIEDAFPGSSPRIEHFEGERFSESMPFTSAVSESLSTWNAKIGFSPLRKRPDIILPAAVIGLGDKALSVDERRAYLEMLWLYFWQFQDAPQDEWLMRHVTDALTASYVRGDEVWRKRVVDVLRFFMSETEIVAHLKAAIEQSLGRQDRVSPTDD